jgi:hypothetical protein
LGEAVFVKELVEILAKALVDQPERVVVEQIEKEKSILIELKVAPEDMGKVIGRQGRIARAIRTVAKAAAGRKKKKVTVEIV